MEVRVSPEREVFVRRLVEEGHYPSLAAVVEAALRLLETRTRVSPLRAAVALGLEQALAGGSGSITADDVARRARGRAT